MSPGPWPQADVTGIEGWARQSHVALCSPVSSLGLMSQLVARYLLSFRMLKSSLSLTIAAVGAKNSGNYVSIEKFSSNKVLTTVNALLADIRYLLHSPLSLCNRILFISCAVLPCPLPLTWLNQPRNEDLKQHSLTHLVQIVTVLV